MKKILFILSCFLFITACQKKVPSIHGNEYILTETPDNVEITLAFAPNENRFFGKAVNRYFGTYQINGNQLILGPIGSTMMMGPEKDMNAEQQYFQDLARVKTFQVTEDTLTIILSDNKKLIFQKKENSVE